MIKALDEDQKRCWKKIEEITAELKLLHEVVQCSIAKEAEIAAAVLKVQKRLLDHQHGGFGQALFPMEEK